MDTPSPTPEQIAGRAFELGIELGMLMAFLFKDAPPEKRVGDNAQILVNSIYEKLGIKDASEIFTKKIQPPQLEEALKATGLTLIEAIYGGDKS